MNIKIKTLGFTAKSELTDYIGEKLAKLFQIYDKIISIEVCLCTEKSATNHNKLCDVRLIIPGNDLLANAKCATFEESVALSVEALTRQVEKRKAKTAAKKRIV